MKSRNFKKQIIMLGLILASVIANTASAVETAGYVRAWQGFKKPEMDNTQFLNAIPPFMSETVTLYKDQNGILNNYIVVIPPEDKPNFIPDELALVGLSSKVDYQRVRQTPEGIKYSESHWTVFAKDVSKSSEPLFLPLPSENTQQNTPPVQHELQHNQAYDLIGKPIDWSVGYTAVFIGARKSDVTPTEFLPKLLQHVYLAKDIMTPKGLGGYIIIANENYEVAYLNWSSQADHDKAVKSPGGQAVFADGGKLMETLMYQPATPITAGDEIAEEQAYSTINN